MVFYSTLDFWLVFTLDRLSELGSSFKEIFLLAPFERSPKLMIFHHTVRRINKAGYTATSCGRVGRGGNARFHTFRLVLTEGPTDRPTDQRTDGQSLL